MEIAYTPGEIANILASYATMKERHRVAQHRYYERNADAKKAYAANYYQRKKEARLAAQREAPSDPVVLPGQPSPA
jgi:Zn-finger nucleic acid-binding protein